VKAYWANLSDRDRWTLSIGIIFCVLYLFYLLIYAPIVHAVHQKSQQLIEKQETLLWMQNIQKEYKARKKPEALSSGQLLSVLAEQLGNTSFKQYPYQLQQIAANDIQLSFDKVPFNSVMQWLWSINEKYTISIKRLNVDHTDTAGVVKLTVVLMVA
jgi:general secretion pathway protein M